MLSAHIGCDLRALGSAARCCASPLTVPRRDVLTALAGPHARWPAASLAPGFARAGAVRGYAQHRGRLAGWWRRFMPNDREKPRRGSGGVKPLSLSSPLLRARLPSPQQSEAKMSASDVEMNMILGKTLQRTTSSTIRCTLINEEGRVQINHGEFKRADLVAQFGLLPRDLRKLDVSTHNIVPAILVRDKAIVVNLLHIRAIIKPHCVLLVDVTPSTPEDAKLQSLFLYDLEHKLRIPSNLTYEQRALETILVNVVATLDNEYQHHAQSLRRVLVELEHSLSRDHLQHLLVESKQLGAFLQKVTLIRNELQDLIDNDKDMSGLYLSKEPPKDDSDVEVMLESYYSQCDEIVQAAESLDGNIRSTEEYMNILLDSNRNSLMLLELRFQIGMLGLSTGSFLAALYGMNLQNMIEDTNWGFFAVSGVVGVVSLATVVLCLKRLARLGRVRERFR